MMMSSPVNATNTVLKWTGSAMAELAGPTTDQIWPFLEDFFGLDKWFPALTTCIPVEGFCKASLAVFVNAQCSAPRSTRRV
ncbi:hypothetical protein MLD38_006875 [Melastoma candidum]|uniref:Uncharacterized protein n=1 Tax=Melastoma candidum TaxID=119954 RepID=A0ACB9RPA7_9MYRT|nr:hypothetical protein MLD38_006875 [Melastoma candidum]